MQFLAFRLFGIKTFVEQKPCERHLRDRDERDDGEETLVQNSGHCVTASYKWMFKVDSKVK